MPFFALNAAKFLGFIKSKFFIYIVIASLLASYHFYVVIKLKNELSDLKNKVETLTKDNVILENNNYELISTLEANNKNLEIINNSHSEEVAEIKKLLRSCNKKQQLKQKIEVPIEGCEQNATITIDVVDSNSTDALKILGEIGL